MPLRSRISPRGGGCRRDWNSLLSESVLYLSASTSCRKASRPQRQHADAGDGAHQEGAAVEDALPLVDLVEVDLRVHRNRTSASSYRSIRRCAKGNRISVARYCQPSAKRLGAWPAAMLISTKPTPKATAVEAAYQSATTRNSWPVICRRTASTEA